MTLAQQNAEEEAMMAQYEAELQREAANQPYGNPNYAATMYGGQQKQNLVEWQLDFKSEMENIERALRCDILIRDKEGNQIWVRNPNVERIFMNDLGVNDVTRTIIMLVNKGKVLSNYGDEEIGKRVKMIINEIRTLIYNNYESYGIDNDYKMNNYSMMVIALNSMIEDAYRRAINGMERKDLNQARVVQQNEPIMQQGMGYPSSGGRDTSKKFNALLPWTWGKG